MVKIAARHGGAAGYGGPVCAGRTISGWKGQALSDTSEDVFTRLSLVLEDWDAQVARSHEELSLQCRTAREHLDRLLQPISAAQGGDLEEALTLAREELAARAAAEASLEGDLRDAAAEIESLAQALEEARAALPADGAPTDGDVETLRAALDLMRLEHAEAQDQIRALKQALEEAGGRPAPLRDDTGIPAFDDKGHKKRMGEILVELGLLTEVQLKSLLKEQIADPHRRLGQLVVDHGFTTEEMVARIIAAQLRLPYRELEDTDVQPAAVQAVSPHVVRLHRCLPVQLEDNVLTVAMTNPLDLIAIEDVELASRCRVSPVVATPGRLDELIALFYPEDL